MRTNILPFLFLLPALMFSLSLRSPLWNIHTKLLVPRGVLSSSSRPRNMSKLFSTSSAAATSSSSSSSTSSSPLSGTTLLETKENDAATYVYNEFSSLGLSPKVVQGLTVQGEE